MNIKLIVALGFLLTSIFIGWCCYDYGYNSAQSEQIQTYETQLEDLKTQADNALNRERNSYKNKSNLRLSTLKRLRNYSTMKRLLLMSIALTISACATHSKPRNVPMCPSLPTAPSVIMQPQQADFTTEMSNFLFGMPQEQTP